MAAARLAIQQQFEYRFNLAVDTTVVPVFLALVEMALWWAICTRSSTPLIAGFSRESYLAYALWAAFFARVQMSWLYESKMVNEVYSGSVNALLVRPVSFYEFYLGQFLGYKLMSAILSLWIPAVIVLLVPGTGDLSRLPLAILSLFFYLLLVHTISFAVAAFAFFYNRVNALTGVKNLTLWMVSGELFPLDLLPGRLKPVILALPFANGVYMPVGYLTGRIDVLTLAKGQISTAVGLLVMGAFGTWLWRRGLKSYTGTGA